MIALMTVMLFQNQIKYTFHSAVIVDNYIY